MCNQFSIKPEEFENRRKIAVSKLNELGKTDLILMEPGPSMR